ncbi:Lipase domain protein, partial [Globisporangium splendens]
MYPAADSSRELMGVSNTLMAGLLYRTLIHFSDFYTDSVAGWSAIAHRPTLDHRKTGWRWLKYVSGKRFSQMFPVFIVSYMVLRLLLGWRNSVIFDFLPLTNIITPARLSLVHGKRVHQPYLLLDSIVITVYEALLLGVALYKCSCAYDSFRQIFVQDFVRIFTEFGVFVVYFRDTILYMLVGGHIAAWSVPFDRLFSRVDWDESTTTIRVIQMGAVQQQLGYLICFAVWFITTMYCALPDDSIGLKGWLTGTNVIKHKHQFIKYFLYESDVYMKTKFTNLKDIEHIDPSHFIMDKQVEAFNLAQLVYACGKHEGSFNDPELEIAHIQKLIMDPQFTIVEIIQDKATDTHCLLLASPTMIVAAFRGTSSKKNAKTDLKAAVSVHRTTRQLDFSKMPSLSGRARPLNAVNLDALTQTKRTWWHRILCKRNPPKVHSGFYTAYLTVEKRVLTRIRALHDQDPRKILATGHSLGGALAVLCSFDVVAQLKIANVTCTTFGCPRVGNTSFKKKYNHAVPATFAFVNAADLVTKLPPKTPKALSYTSVGTIVLINAFGNLVIAPNVLELAVLHKGYSAKSHTLKAYHLSLLLWCLRSHRMQYHPRFWRQLRREMITFAEDSSSAPSKTSIALPRERASDGATSMLLAIFTSASQTAGKNHFQQKTCEPSGQNATTNTLEKHAHAGYAAREAHARAIGSGEQTTALRNADRVVSQGEREREMEPCCRHLYAHCNTTKWRA